MRFNIDDYHGDYAMHCPEEWQAEVFTNYLDSLGKSWRDGSTYVNNSLWYEYEEEQCYAFNRNQYESVSWYKGTGYIILEFSDFDWGDEDFTLSAPDETVLISMLR